jgi:N-methylhydantoinase B
MLRTSYSQILNSSRDYSIAVCDRECRLIAQADHIPIHVGALSYAAQAVEERFKSIVPGDVFLLNDPYAGGSHLPDLTAFVPVFDGGEMLLWAIVRAHHSDIGGATYGGYNPGATEIFQEGLRIPPIRLCEGGKQRDDVVDLLALNVRNPRDFKGDLDAMVGAARLGERRLTQAFFEFGRPVIMQAIGAILDSSERQARHQVSEWKDGVFYGEAFLDDDGRGNNDLRIAAKVTKKGSDIEVDLSESHPQTESFVNSPHANTQAAVAMAVAYLLDPAIPKNSGTLRVLSVKLKQGTIVLPDPGHAVTLCTNHPASEICEAVIKALSQSCPQQTMAGWGKRFRIAIQGVDPRTKTPFIWHMFHARPGGGASSGGDGWSSVGDWPSAGAAKFGSIEDAEVRFPLFFERHEFLPGSGGEGQYRGGLGVALDLHVETQLPATGNTAGDGVRYGSCGMLGGEDGKPHNYQLVGLDGKRRVLRTKEGGIPIPAGAKLEIRSAGGGGWGMSKKRSADAKRSDLLNEMINGASA